MLCAVVLTTVGAVSHTNLSPPLAPTPASGSAQWYVLPFSRSVIMGPSMVDANTVFFAYGDNGGELASVMKTTDGGQSFVDLEVEEKIPSFAYLGVAAKDATHLAVAGAAHFSFSNDGQTIHAGAGPSLVNSVLGITKANDNSFYGSAGQFGLPGAEGQGKVTYGVATSKDGLVWKGFNASSCGLDLTTYNPRYAAFPSATTWYATLGNFPSDDDDDPLKDDDQSADDDDVFKASELELIKEFSPRLRLFRNTKTGQFRFKPRSFKGRTTPFAGAIVKTTDGGATWTTQYHTLGNNQTGSYVNGIHCSDENTCVAGQDDDVAASILSTQDGGKTWTSVATEVPGASCTKVKFVSATEVFVLCTVFGQQPSQTETHVWHSTDAGKSFSSVVACTKYAGTDFDMFDGKNGWATVLGPDNRAHLAKYTTVAPTPPPTPPPSPPRPGQTHYGDPYKGLCESGELNITITGFPGATCAPACIGLLHLGCPKDLPEGPSGQNVTAIPGCTLSNEDTGDHNCALQCGSDDICPAGASCKAAPNPQQPGLCTYDDMAPPTPAPPAPTPAPPTPPPTPTPPTPAPTPAPPTPPPPPTPATHYGNPYKGACLPDEARETEDNGDICMPKCIKSGLFKETCPTDLPAGVASSVHAVCAFKGDDKVKRCHLEGCLMDADCGPGANCKVHKYSDDDGVVPAVGICAYNAVNITHATYTFTINH